MSRAKDRERAKHFVYRNGRKIPRGQWDKYQRELRELAEEQRLKALGLVKVVPRFFTAERQGIEKAKKQVQQERLPPRFG